jgi:putative radical SAM enzyme (TIGR03279 family)
LVRIAAVERGSIAEELELEIGTRIIRINGQKVRDGIDLTFLLADPELELETLSPSGEAVVYDVERDPGEALGIVPAPDTVRECANKCVFCFIDGNPEGVRQSLWLRDDDFRLSFAYGSYVTLTNLGPKGLQRLIDQRISPLYVSVHATEPEVRRRLLVNDRAGLIMDQLRLLLDGGLEVHTQVVLCPEWNDGAHLDRTIDELYGLGDGVRSLSVVPVGLTRYNLNRPVRPLTPEEARQAIDQVARARIRAGAERGVGWAYAADEMFLIADEEIPAQSYYDDWPLTENGVGAVRRFVEDFDSGIVDLARPPALGDAGRVWIVTGLSMEGFIRDRVDRLQDAIQAPVEVVPVQNRFFGPSVTIAGLLGGQDILEDLEQRVGAKGGARPGDLVMIPAEALNDDELFIDSLPLADFEAALAPARVVGGYEIVEALRAL